MSQRARRPTDKQWLTTPSTLGALALVFLLFSVWQSAGSRPALFACTAIVVVAVVDVVWSQAVTRRAQVRVLANPAEAFVGDPVALDVDLCGCRQSIEIDMTTFDASPVTVDLPTRHRLVGRSRRRELLGEVTVEVTARGLAGVMAAQRRQTVVLARPLAIGPRPIRSAEPLPDLPRGWGDGEPRPAPTGDVVRGVRPYIPGDPLRRVHWRATARAGDLVVKEVEDIGVPRLMIALSLGNGGERGERAAGRAAWYALEGLRRDYDVVLATIELAVGAAGLGRRRTVVGPVRTQADVIRRLATASPPGAPELSPEQHGGGVLFVTDEGDGWR